MLWSGYLY